MNNKIERVISILITLPVLVVSGLFFCFFFLFPFDSGYNELEYIMKRGINPSDVILLSLILIPFVISSIVIFVNIIKIIIQSFNERDNDYEKSNNINEYSMNEHNDVLKIIGLFLYLLIMIPVFLLFSYLFYTRVLEYSGEYSLFYRLSQGEISTLLGMAIISIPTFISFISLYFTSVRIIDFISDSNKEKTFYRINGLKLFGFIIVLLTLIPIFVISIYTIICSIIIGINEGTLFDSRMLLPVGIVGILLIIIVIGMFSSVKIITKLNSMKFKEE